MKRKLLIPAGIAIVIFLTGLISYAGNTVLTKHSTKIYGIDLKMKECIDACNNCAVMCNNCASMCLKEKDVSAMSRCVQLCMECAGMCVSVSQQMSLGSDNYKELCKICADACKKCADECSKFSNDHCKKCAEACSKAADLCRKM